MIRWAVSGTGTMADLFLKDSRRVQNGQFVAVFSHSHDRAESFAERHQLKHFYDNYDQMLASSDIDAVYIASNHPQHASQAISALNAGKHVLIEKPMALTEAEAKAVFDAAKANKRFCAEALWSKFNPTYQALIEQLTAGRIGEVRQIQANFGFLVDMNNPSQRLLNAQHAGGALLDIGLYPIFLPLSILGYPDETIANVQIGPTGVDIATDIIMCYQSGASATVSYRFDSYMPTKASLSGSKGWVEMDAPWFSGNTLSWYEEGRPVVTEHYAMVNRGWGIEFERVNECINQQVLEAPEHSWQNSLQLAKYLQLIRTEWGPTYPFER